jgi:hypothetical protein
MILSAGKRREFRGRTKKRGFITAGKKRKNHPTGWQRRAGGEAN